MIRHSTRFQRTILRPAEVAGTGLLSGEPVVLRFNPAAPESGIVFARVDLPGSPRLHAHAGTVTDTRRRTTLGRAPAHVSLVEHVLAALAGLRVDNCLIEIDGPEPPGLDGSAHGFVEAILNAGVVPQPAERVVWSVSRPIVVRSEGASLTLHPPGEGHQLTLSYFLDYGPLSPIVRQVYTCDLTPSVFVEQVSSARTFLLEAEAYQLRRQGLGLRTTPKELLVFGPRGPIDNTLRFADEPARHKVLDLVGDLSLLGADLCGHVVACRSGHPLNVELARVLATMLPVTNGQPRAIRKCA